MHHTSRRPWRRAALAVLAAPLAAPAFGGASELVNVQTGEAPLPDFFGDDTLKLLPVPSADAGEAVAEYTGV